MLLHEKRDGLGIWVEPTEGAKFWLKVVKDTLIAVLAEVKDLSDAIANAFPGTSLQTCIVRMSCSSFEYAGWKERTAIAAACIPLPQRRSWTMLTRPWRTSPTLRCYRTVLAARVGDVISFFAIPSEVRRIVYTNEYDRGLHIAEIIKNRDHFRNDEAGFKPNSLALHSIKGTISTAN